MQARQTMVYPRAEMGQGWEIALAGVAADLIGGLFGDDEEEQRAAEYKRQQQAFREQQAAALALAESQRRAAEEAAQLEARRAAASSRKMTQTIEIAAIGVAGLLGLTALIVFSRKK